LIPLIEVLNRAETGPVCELKEWDINIISKKVKEKLKEYGLEGTCDPQNPINTDDSLADGFWRAGFDLAADIGMLCLDTKRIIKFTEEEIKDAIKFAPSEISVGEWKDRISIKSRRPEDARPPAFRSGFGPVSEDDMIPLVQGIVQYRIIDMISSPSLTTIYGYPLKSGTPFETLAGVYEGTLCKEAARRANRPGISVFGPATSPTEYGMLGGYGAPFSYKPSSDLGVILPISELKTSYELLHKVVHVLNHGGSIYGNHWSMIGGYVGPAEGAAAMAVSATILQLLVHRLSISCGVILDMRYSGNVGRDAVWASSVAEQAETRNTNILVGGITSQLSGPCTFEILYEMAVGSIEQTVSGCASNIGNRSAGARYTSHMSPLEQKFGAEVGKASAGLKRDHANEIVKALIPKYEGKLQNPPKGKSFTECFDLKTLQPTKEWRDIYDRVWKELEDLGLPHL